MEKDLPLMHVVNLQSQSSGEAWNIRHISQLQFHILQGNFMQHVLPLMHRSFTKKAHEKLVSSELLL